MEVALRPAAPEDQAFLLAVHMSTRRDELGAVGGEALEALLVLQATAHDQDLRTRHPDAERLVVSVGGTDVGRLYRVLLSGVGGDGGEVEESELCLLDIALLPEWRGRSIGSTLVEDLVAEAQERDLLLSLHVHRDSPARRLYDRLGFVVTAEDEVYARMELRPS